LETEFTKLSELKGDYVNSVNSVYFFFVLNFFCLSVIAQTSTNNIRQTNSTNITAQVSTERLEQVQIDVANGFFLRNFYELALAEYKKYLEWFPNGASGEEAMYRIAECLHEVGKFDAAKNQYQEVQKAFPQGSYFARSSFRLGEMLWNKKNYTEALKKFQEASQRAESSETRLTASFYLARTFIQLNQNQQASPLLQKLAQEEKKNPYRGFALLELGKLLELSGKPEEASLFYNKVLSTDASAVLKSEATLKAGAIAMKQKDWKSAISLFEKLRTYDVPADWINYANTQLIRGYYQNNQYDLVLKLIDTPQTKFPAENQEEIDLLQAHALRLLKKYSEAEKRYGQFIKKYPESNSRESVSHERLICLYALQSPPWDSEAAIFLKEFPGSKNRSRILFLRADLAFQRADFTSAYQHYDGINLKEMDAEKISEILYKQAHSLMQLGQFNDATRIWSDFISRFPNHSLISSAFYQRGLALENNQQLENALKSFQEIINHFPKAKERENATHRSALIQGQLKQYSAMRASFDRLSREFPSNPFTTDALYWTGWSYFEEKKFNEAIPLLEQARRINPTSFGPETTSRIILAKYYLQRREALIKEVDSLAHDHKPLAPEIYDWIARECVKAKDFTSAERYFRKLLAHPESNPWRQATRWDLANTLSILSNWKEAVQIWEEYLKDYQDPSTIIATKLKLVRGYTALQTFDKAQETAEEVMRLQPEGKNNAEARFLMGELMAAQNKHSEAGKYFLSVAVLYEDPEISPRSLSRAIQTFEAAGETNQVSELKKELVTKYPNYKSSARP